MDETSKNHENSRVGSPREVPVTVFPAEYDGPGTHGKHRQFDKTGDRQRRYRQKTKTGDRFIECLHFAAKYLQILQNRQKHRRKNELPGAGNEVPAVSPL